MSSSLNDTLLYFELLSFIFVCAMSYSLLSGRIISINGDCKPLKYSVSCCGSHCNVSHTFFSFCPKRVNK